jgi:N-acylneuraminate cytidylyltransferase/CMP-N,N'-diacetyllegionaminic acid synthase
VITGYESERNPYFNMMEINVEGLAQIVKQSCKPIVRRQDAPVVYSLTPAAYVIKKQALYEYEHWSKAKCKIYSIPRTRAVDIDTAFDFKLVEFLMQNSHEES